MRRFIAAVAVCAIPVVAFASTASASSDYPPDDSEVGTETEERCDDADTGDDGNADPANGTVAGEAGDSSDPDCPPDTSTGDDEATAGIATQRPSADSSGELPSTGSDASVLVRIAAMSVIAGGALIVVGWWRKRPSSA